MTASESKLLEIKQDNSNSLELVVPAALDKVLDAVKRFEEFKEKAITEDDYMTIAGKRFIKKSGLMKYALACAVSLQCIEERRDIDEKTGVITYHFTYKAIAPGGRFAEAVGSAASNEKQHKMSEHNTRALAQTRATNRAISNLVASGQVSAEEVDAEAYNNGNGNNSRPLTPAEIAAREAAKNMGRKAA